MTSSGVQSRTPSSRRSFFWRRTPASWAFFAAAARFRCFSRALSSQLLGLLRALPHASRSIRPCGARNRPHAAGGHSFCSATSAPRQHGDRGRTLPSRSSRGTSGKASDSQASAVAKETETVEGEKKDWRGSHAGGFLRASPAPPVLGARRHTHVHTTRRLRRLLWDLCVIVALLQWR